MDDYRLQVGVVIHAYCHNCKPAKDKYFVIARVLPKPILLFINSKMNAYVEKRPHLHDCHVVITSDHYRFLRHDSLIACCEPYHAFQYDDLLTTLKYDSKAYCGVLTDDDLLKVIEAVTKSPVMVKRDKKRILEALNQRLNKGA